MALAIAGTLYDPTIGPEGKTESVIYKGLLSGFKVNELKENLHPMLIGERHSIDGFSQNSNSPIPQEIAWLYK